MEPDVQRTVDTVSMENSVTMLTEPVKMVVRLDITKPAVQKVFWRKNKHRQNLITSQYLLSREKTFTRALQELL